MRSLRNTTLPGVAAMFLPTVKADRSTLRGSPPLVVRSVMKLRMPRMRLTPPVSKARFSAAGLVARKLVGAMASTSARRAKVALPFQGSSSSARASRSSTRRDQQAVGLAGGEEGGVVFPGLVGEALVLAGRRQRPRRLEARRPARRRPAPVRPRPVPQRAMAAMRRQGPAGDLGAEAAQGLAERDRVESGEAALGGQDLRRLAAGVLGGGAPPLGLLLAGRVGHGGLGPPGRAAVPVARVPSVCGVAIAFDHSSLVRLRYSRCQSA